MTANNGLCRITEVPQAEVPGDRRGAHWDDLYRDVRLRLEQTPPRYALRLEFDENDTARKATNALRARFKKHEPDGYVHLRVTTQNVFVWRGENYVK